MYRVTESWQLTRALSAVFFPTVDSTIRSAGTVVAAISLREVFSNFVLFTIVITDWKQIFSTWILFNFDLQKMYYVALFIFSQFRFVIIQMIKHIVRYIQMSSTVWNYMSVACTVLLLFSEKILTACFLGASNSPSFNARASVTSVTFWEGLSDRVLSSLEIAC